MSTLMDVLAWKTGYKSGMFMVDTTIVKWDEAALGYPKPNQDTIDAWTTEYTIWKEEQATIAAAAIAFDENKLQEFIDNLPSWNAISTAIDGVTTVAGLRTVVKKLARVVYLLARNQDT